MKNINIKKIRKKLDKIDLKLLRIIKERFILVDQVVKLKKTKKEIIDKRRIDFILKRIKKKSIHAKIDPKITTAIWKEMINAFIKYEYRYFKKK
jgi:chorismate mutase|tara:strand:- start:65 stop:346 length:282 start_codon:yes stop_codon:yes gene_type:complete